MLKAVEKKKAYEDIVEQIRGLIEEGKLKSGDHLPSERELTETFRVSRTTVREAIRTLESMKLVKSRHGDGTYILASNEEALVQPLAAALFSGKDDIIDIFFVRKIIEPYIARLAAENASPEEIEEMEKILREQAGLIERGENTVNADSAFHSVMARTAKNRVMERLLLAIVDLLRRTREEYLVDDKRAKKSLQGHWKVLESIRSRDCAVAQKSMLRHLEDIEGILFGKKKKRGGGLNA